MSQWTSRQRVLTCFAHQQPDRVPCWCGASVEFWEKAKRELKLDDEALRVRFGDDFRRVFGRWAGPDVPLSPGATWRSPFGVERHGYGYGHPITNPLASANLQQVHDYPWPDPKWVDVSAIRAEALAYSKQYAILGGDWSPFWHDVIDLLGMETMYEKMYDEPEVVKAVFTHVVDYYFMVNQRLFAAADALDIFFIGNDLGSQTGPLLGPLLFEEFVLPHLSRLINLGHSYKLKVMLHCCGGIRELLPLLIKVGLDAVHAIQPCCRGMDLAELKRDFGDKIVFNGAVDSQHILINAKSAAEVREKTREVLKVMMPGGGYIAGASHDTILEETPVENVLAMFDTIREFGKYTP